MNLAWKTYLIFIISLYSFEFSLRGYISYQTYSELYFSPRNQFELITTIVGFVGVFGYLYKKRIISHLFWCFYFMFSVLYLFWDTYQDILFEKNLAKAFSTTPNVFVTIMEASFGYLLILPLYFALFLYSFKSKELWNYQVQVDQSTLET